MQALRSRWTRLLATAGLLLAVAAAHAAPQPTQYSFTPVSVPGFEGSALFGINNAGQTVGYVYDGNGPSRAIVGTPGAYNLLTGPSGAIGAWGMGISEGGEVVGSYYSTEVVDPETGELVPGPAQGFILSGGEHTIVGSAASDTYLRAISPNGRYVTGYTVTAEGLQGFVLDRSTSATTVIGTGTSVLIPQGVTDNGLVVGSDRILGAGAAGRVGFTFDVHTGVRQDYAHPGVLRTAFRDINAHGTIAGWATTADGIVGLLGTPGSFITIAYPGAVNTWLEGLNDQGWLVGGYDLGDGVFHAFVARPVPEPATWGLMAGGLVLLLAARRRRA